MTTHICGSLRTANTDESDPVSIAIQIYAETARWGFAIQLAETISGVKFPDSANLPDVSIRKACLYAASKIDGNLIFNLLDNPLSNTGHGLLDDLNPWFGKNPEDAPLMKFMKWLLTSEYLDSAAVYIEEADILMEIAGELIHDPPYELDDEFECTKEEFFQNLHEYFPRKTEGKGEGLFIIQM